MMKEGRRQRIFHRDTLYNKEKGPKITYIHPSLKVSLGEECHTLMSGAHTHTHTLRAMWMQSKNQMPVLKYLLAQNRYWERHFWLWDKITTHFSHSSVLVFMHSQKTSTRTFITNTTVKLAVTVGISKYQFLHLPTFMI